MTYQEFVNKYNGKGIDYDGNYGVQCFDLANQYCKDVIGCTGFSGMYAHQIYNDFNTQANRSNFERIANTPDFVPKKGDIMVWASTLNGKAGHVAICTGEGDTKNFYSYDQNWTGRNDPMTKIKHDYSHVLGVLRPKDQRKVTGSTTATVKGADSIGTILIPGYYVVTANTLNVRKSPNTSAQIVGIKMKNEQVRCYSFSYGTNSTWAKIDRGYICVNMNSENYVRVYGTVQCDTLNVRKTPGGAVCGSVKKGQKFQITKENKGWSYSPEAGGWMSNEYLR